MATPYLHFQGNCREAMTAYAEILGGKLELMTYSQAPDDAPAEMRTSDAVMHGSLLSDRYGHLMASDYPPGHPGEAQAAVSISIASDDLDGARAAFDAFAIGGQVFMPFGPTFFAKGFGMVKDRFGTTWMVMVAQ
ncbi:MAG: VOC family protein [Burkholderiaceae bacterium]